MKLFPKTRMAWRIRQRLKRLLAVHIAMNTLVAVADETQDDDMLRGAVLMELAFAAWLKKENAEIAAMKAEVAS